MYSECSASVLPADQQPSMCARVPGSLHHYRASVRAQYVLAVNGLQQRLLLALASSRPDPGLASRPVVRGLVHLVRLATSMRRSSYGVDGRCISRVAVPKVLLGLLRPNFLVLSMAWELKDGTSTGSYACIVL